MREKGQRSEVRGSTHPRPGRRAERPGEGERSRTAPSAEEEPDEPRPETRRKRRRKMRRRRSRAGVEGKEEQPRKLSRTQEVEGGNGGRETNTRGC